MIWVPSVEEWIDQAESVHCTGNQIISVRVSGETVVSARAWGFKCSDESYESAALFGARVEKALAEFDLPVADSPQGVASGLLRRILPDSAKTNYVDNLNDMRRIRVAYRGGYTGVVSSFSAGKVIKIDRNSSYPAEIAEGIPYDYRPAGKNADIVPDGIYEAEVFVPYYWDIIPPLPIRVYPSGTLIYPVGRVVGTFVGVELLWAKKIGVEIRRVFDSWIPHGNISGMDIAPLILKLYSARQNHPWMKLVLNSMAGFLGRREYVTVNRYLGNEDVSPGEIEIDLGGFRFGQRDVWAPSDWSQPGAAAVITARARVALLDMAYAMDPDFVLYLDTDSVIVRVNNRTEALANYACSDKLGAWKIEKLSNEYSCVALRRISWKRTNQKWEKGQLVGGRMAVTSCVTRGAHSHVLWRLAKGIPVTSKNVSEVA